MSSEYELSEINMQAMIHSTTVKPLVKQPPHQKNQGTPSRDCVKPVSCVKHCFANDTLFWCYYTMKHGELAYELLPNKSTLSARQLKIELVEYLRANKTIVKSHKLDTLSNLERNLANDDEISIETVLTLCAIDTMNVVFMRSKQSRECVDGRKHGVYYKLVMASDVPTYVIRAHKINNYVTKYSCEKMESLEQAEQLCEHLYELSNLKKPLKAASSYKVQELRDIGIKLGLNAESMSVTKDKLYRLIADELI